MSHAAEPMRAAVESPAVAPIAERETFVPEFIEAIRTWNHLL
ncbi:hypothetical protein [Candidatus Poriferisodalis sp.]